MKKPIYLDNNATTMVAPEVVASMLPFYEEYYANPSSVHFFGQEVAKKLQEARNSIASSLDAEPDEIVFTASGSEADNLCIKGYCEANKEKGTHIITSIVEHPAIINSCKHLEQNGYTVTYLPVDDEGFVSVTDVENAITPNTVLVSVMHANNEVGAIQPMEEIAELCARHAIAFHTDAVQSFTKLPLSVKKTPITMASVAGHKFHAPKGIGFAYIRKGTQIVRQNDGGGQERKLRAGTENAGYIAGLATAIELCSEQDTVQMKKLQKYLIDQLTSRDGIRLNGPANLEKRVCNNINISTSKMNGELLLQELSKRGICVSTGSACSSKSTTVSPILLAINCPPEYLHGNIRISTSRYTTKAEIDAFLEAFDAICNKENQFVLQEA